MPDERSMSLDGDDSDLDSLAGSTGPGKPGRKKNPNSQAARRDQNRIAQREFRLRKQQRIRDLEARVEILSGGKDEALGEMRNILKDLMQENQTLRGLLRSLGSFIGDGAGGLLPKLGWEMADFTNFINRSETDTAWEGYQQRKKTHTVGEAGSSSQGAKRAAEDDSNGTRAKKPRGSGADADVANGYSMLHPMQPPVTPNSIYPPSRTSQDGNGMFSDMMKNNGSTMFAPSASPSSASPQYTLTPTSSVNNYQTSYIPTVNMNIEPTLPQTFNNPSSSSSTGQQRKTNSHDLNEQIDDDDDPNKNEAYKLIHYHLENYKRNSAYCLPSSLRPTLVQRTVPHEGVIDRILHPELRDRMILLRGRFDLVDCLLEYRAAVTIHGDDVLAHSNWEIGEKWLRQYGFLVDAATLAIMNRWRRERGEPELRLNDISSAENTPASTA